MDHDAATRPHRRKQFLDDGGHTVIVDHADADVIASRAKLRDGRRPRAPASTNG